MSTRSLQHSQGSNFYSASTLTYQLLIRPTSCTVCRFMPYRHQHYPFSIQRKRLQMSSTIWITPYERMGGSLQSTQVRTFWTLLHTMKFSTLHHWSQEPHR